MNAYMARFYVRNVEYFFIFRPSSNARIISHSFNPNNVRYFKYFKCFFFFGIHIYIYTYIVRYTQYLTSSALNKIIISGYGVTRPIYYTQSRNTRSLYF